MSLMKSELWCQILSSILPIIFILLSVAFITLAERKILSLVMFRLGPSKTSVQGILQPIADAMKLANKSYNTLSNFSMFMYYTVVIVMMMMSLMLWSNTMMETEIIEWKFSFLVLMAILGVMAIKSIMAGWSTNCKYSLLGSMRTVSQMISYESIIYLCFMNLIWVTKSFKISDISSNEMLMLIVTIPIFCMMWFPSILAELNRTPYDFSEGESELVSGFNTEFGSSSFTLIFLSEYSNIIFFMMLTSTMFFMMESKLMTMLVLMMMNFWIIWVRSVLPRMRFDKFMSKAWKFYIPFTTILLLVNMFFI